MVRIRRFQIVHHYRYIGIRFLSTDCSPGLDAAQRLEFRAEDQDRTGQPDHHQVNSKDDSSPQMNLEIESTQDKFLGPSVETPERSHGRVDNLIARECLLSMNRAAALHGIGLANEGFTIWRNGKLTGTVRPVGPF